MKAQKLAIFCLTMCMFFAACQKEKPTVQPVSSQASSEQEEVIDPNWPALVRTAVLEEMPEVIVSLSPALTEYSYELGQPLSGVSQFCDYPEEVSSLKRFGTAASPDLEALKKAAPDLILSSVPLGDYAKTVLEEGGSQILVIPRTDTFDALEDTYIDLATAFFGIINGPEKGLAVYEPLQKRYEALASDSKLGEVSGIWLRSTPLLMATGDTWESALLEDILGVKNDAKEYTAWQYPPEKAVDLYPDIIFYASSITTDYFKNATIYNTTDAYKQNKLYPFDPLPFERQSGRILDELERMADAMASGSAQPAASAEAPSA